MTNPLLTKLNEYINNKKMNFSYGNLEHIATLAEIGLQSMAEEDRVLALEAANHFDEAHGTSYGGQVLELFMQQQQLSFIDKDESYSPQAACMQPDWLPGPSFFGAETPRVARMQKAVYGAVGEEIGVKMTIRHFVADDAEGVPLMADILDENMAVSPQEVIPLPDGRQARLSVSEERPFEVTLEHARKNSGKNFHIGVIALMGDAL